MSWTYRDRIIESVVAEYAEGCRKLAVTGTMMVGRTTMVSQYPRYFISAPDVGEEMPGCDTVVMRPMTLFETSESNGDVSMSSLFDGGPLPDSESNIEIYELCRIMCRGGWPVMFKNGRQLGKNSYDYLQLTGDPTIPRAIAKHVSDTASFSDVVRSIGCGMARVVADLRLKQLKQIMMVENIPSLRTNLRPKDHVLTRDQWCFVDPSVYCALADLRPAQMEKDPRTIPPAFFNLVIRDVRVYTTHLGGELFHYRTRSGFDGGIVIKLRDGRWASIGICSDKDGIDDVADRMMEIIHAGTDHEGPVFGMIVIPNGKTHVRDDGIFVVPIGCLRD